MSFLGELLSIGTKFSADLVVKKILDFIAAKAAFLLIGPLGWFCKAAVKALVKYLIWPAFGDLLGEGAYLIREDKIAEKVTAYEGAQTDEEIDSAFDNLLSGR